MKYIKYLFFILLLSLNGTLSAAEKNANADTKTPAPPPELITLAIDHPLPAKHPLETIDLTKTTLQLTAANAPGALQKKINTPLVVLAKKAELNINHALSAVAKRAELYPAIAGIMIESAVPLNHQAANDVAVLASKAAWLSMHFTLQTADDWALILKAAHTNPYLLTMIYSAPAIEQIQKEVALSGALIAPAPIIQFFAPTVSKGTQAQKFWQAVAKDSKTNETNRIIMVFNSTPTAPASQNIATLLKSAEGHLIWIGEMDHSQFIPLNQHAATFHVWRWVNNEAKHFSVERNAQPYNLYLALGMNPKAYDVLSTLIKRSQELAKHNVVVSTKNLAQQGALVDLSNTTLIEGDSLFMMGPHAEHATAAHSTILLFNPSKAALNRWLASINYSLMDISHLAKLSILDYSTAKDGDFYQTMVPVMDYTKKINVAYNALLEDNLNSFLLQNYGADRVDLGRKASKLLLKTDEKKSTCVELKTMETDES